MTRAHPRWLRQLLAATRINASNEELLSTVAQGETLSTLEAAVAVARRLHEGPHLLPYRFRPPQKILDLEACRRRGYGACGDASAAVAAAVLMVGGVPVLCYEVTPTVDGYAHVRIDVDGTFVDAFPDASFDVDRCAARLALTRSVVRWPLSSSPVVDVLPLAGQG
jgi:hypothetical protein